MPDKEVLETRMNSIENQVKKHEADIEKIKEDVGDLKTHAGEMKVYISQIFGMFDEIKTQLNVLRDREENTREKGSNMWLDFFQKFFYLIAGAIVSYMFAKMK